MRFNKSWFWVNPPPRINVREFSPNSANALVETYFNAYGSNFDRIVNITDNNNACTHSVIGNFQVQFTSTVPSTDGIHTFRFFSVDGLEDTLTFEYIVPPDPTIVSIFPEACTTGGTQTIFQLFGTGFVYGASVTFNGVPATSVTVGSDTWITCIAPSSALAGTADVVVTNLGEQTSGSSGNDIFTYSVTAEPTISSLTPDTGWSVGGSAITDLAGTGFEEGAIVLFEDGTNMGYFLGTDVVVESSTKITCVVPAHTPELAGVLVYNTNGLVSNFGLITFLAAPTVNGPTVPSTGVEAGGRVISNLPGTGFIDGATVTFDGEPATDVVWVSATKLTCVTPAGELGTADVVVTNPDGQTSGATGNAAFTYAPPLEGLAGFEWTGYFVDYDGGTWEGVESTNFESLGRDATVNEGTPTVGTRNSHGVALLDGATQFITATDATSDTPEADILLGPGEWTFACIFTLDSVEAHDSDVYDNAGIVACENLKWGLYSSTSGVMMTQQDGGYQTLTFACPADSLPHRLVARFDGSDMYATLDGGVEQSISCPFSEWNWNPGSKILFGTNRENGSGRFHNGEISFVGFMDVDCGAVTLAEIDAELVTVFAL